MNQPYFIVVLAHSLHGRIRRFHIDQKIIVAVLGLALLGCFTLFGMVSSYLRMAWKVAQYNELRSQTNLLRGQYEKLLTETRQTSDQMARLQLLASEVSIAYGIKQNTTGDARATMPSMNGTALDDSDLRPSFSETLAEYDLLKSAKLSVFASGFARRYMRESIPTIWPIMGRLLSHYGQREDPFSGLQHFHSGVDISAVTGTPVRVAGDGMVISAEYAGAYGKLIIVDHGRGLQTYYGHLSRIDVLPGQEVHVGQFIGATGATGRVTAPHLHYEVRIGGSPVNAYTYLAHSLATPSSNRQFGF